MVRVTLAVAARLVVLGFVTPTAPPAVAGHHGDHHGRAAPHARAGIPVERLRQPQFVSATRGYALVIHRDQAGVGIAVTLDGGRRWTPRQHPSFGTASDRRISADALSLTVTRRRLLVWGPSGLFAARENGSRWHHAIADRVGQVDAVGSSAWATTWSCDPGRHCRGWLRVSRDFGRTWSKRAHLPRGVGPRRHVPRLVRATRRTAYLVRPEIGRNGALAVTTDGGRSWFSRPLPHRTEHEFIGFMPLAVDSAGGLWLTIPGEPSAGNEVKAVYLSDDEGRTWTRVAITSPPSLRGRANLSTVGYVANLVAGSSDTAYLLLHRAAPLATTTGGRRWHWAFSAPHIPHRTDFTDVWLDTLGRSRAWFWTNGSHHLWTTRDGGRTWEPVAGYPIRRHLPRCTSDQLRVWVRDSGSVMSQPYARIALRNVGSSACALRGYPQITAWGGPVGQRGAAPLSIQVKRGAFYEARDRGPKRVGLRPGSRAVFSIGTATAYSAHLVEIERLGVGLPGGCGIVSVPLDLYATAPPGKHIPVSVTAIDWRVR